jgi:hypothetical protein
MSNALSEEKRQQVIALGRLGWPLRRIEQETGVRRETASAYLKSAGVGVRPPRAWGRRPPAKPANEVITGSTEESPARNGNPNPKSLPEEGKGQTAKPANEVITGFGVGLSGVGSKNHSPTPSCCEPFREATELGLSDDANSEDSRHAHEQQPRRFVGS